MKINPLKEYELSKKMAYENVILSYWMRNFWDGRADGIEWCIKHLTDKVALQKEYENCLHVKENSARINVPEVMRYYEGRADGVRWCLENFGNLELPEDPGRMEEEWRTKMKLDPRKEREISEKLAHENFEHTMMNMFHFWTGRAGGIGWCINHLNDKDTLQKEYECCLQAKEECQNAPNFVRYYDGRADGVRWCLENFDNLELPEESTGKEE